MAGTGVEENASWQTSVGHVLATGEERTDAVVEDVRVAILVHLSEDTAEIIDAFSEDTKAFGHFLDVVVSGRRDGAKHKWDERAAAGFDRHRDEVKP